VTVFTDDLLADLDRQALRYEVLDQAGYNATEIGDLLSLTPDELHDVVQRLGDAAQRLLWTTMTASHVPRPASELLPPLQSARPALRQMRTAACGH
jgi:hypothetical protein